MSLFRFFSPHSAIYILLIPFLLLWGGTACRGPSLPAEQANSEVRPTAVSSPIPTPANPLAPFAVALKPEETALLADEQWLDATRYDMNLTLNDDLNIIQGQQTIRYTNRENMPLTDFYLRLYPNLFGGSLTLENLTRDGNPLADSQLQYELRDSAVRLPLDPPLPPGAHTTFTLDFTTAVPTSGGGNYAVFLYDDTLDILAPAHFYPFVPVYDSEGEGWQVEIPPSLGDVIYGESSFYRVTIAAPVEQVVATSGTFVATSQSPDGQTRTHTAVAGPMRDFYFITSHQFEVISTTVDGTTINHYGFPTFAASNQFALTTAVASLQKFNELVGPYPFTELDVAMSPTSALGVEYPGLIVNSHTIYLDYAQEALRTTTVHEVGHQWFYSLVGNDQLDEPWLDESLTQYLTLRFLQDDPANQIQARALERQLRGWSQLAQNENVPIGAPVAAYTPDTYGSAVYGAGPLFFANLREQVGGTTFDRFLQTYFDRFRFGLATGADLQIMLEESCGCVLDEAFNTAVYPD